MTTGRGTADKMMQPFPQRKRHRRTSPPSEAEIALRSAIATAQHAAKRGYEIQDGKLSAFKKAYARLRKAGLSFEEACATLRADFAAG